MEVIIKKREKLYEIVLDIICLFLMALLVYRAFQGINFTDECYYVSEALTMLHGNLPYAYNNYTYGTGFPFLLIPQIFIYELIIGNNEGIYLFTRISFLVFQFGAYYVVYRILIKNFKKTSVLCFFLILISYSAGAGVFNYSYNSVPAVLSLLCGVLLFETIENTGEKKAIKFLLIGFLMCVAVLAHPGYGVAVILFGMLIIFRLKQRSEVLSGLGLCLLGGIFELMIVFIPIIVQSGISPIVAGINEIFAPSISNGQSNGSGNLDKFHIIFIMYGNILIIVFAFVIMYFICYFALYSKKESYEKTRLISIFSAACILVLSLFEAYKTILVESIQYRIGMLSLVGLLFFLFSRAYNKYPILYYIGLYPILFSFLLIAKVNTANPKYRFSTAIISMAVVFMIFMENEVKEVRAITIISVLACVLAMQKCNFVPIVATERTDRITEGVFKGIYVSKELANDLPELERYLNDAIDEDESYSFRDMAPYCYLMMHNGNMCDVTTWDSLNYFGAHINSPQRLFLYYDRRGVQPDKIIFVKYRLFEDISYYQENLKYNKYIEENYFLEEENSIGTEFEEILVFSRK